MKSRLQLLLDLILAAGIAGLIIAAWSRDNGWLAWRRLRRWWTRGERIDRAYERLDERIENMLTDQQQPDLRAAACTRRTLEIAKIKRDHARIRAIGIRWGLLAV